MIICPEDIYKTIPKGVTEVEVSWVPPTDTQGRPATSSTHSPGDMFSPGTTIVTYSATYDNILEECSFSIFVEQGRQFFTIQYYHKAKQFSHFSQLKYGVSLSKDI